MSVFHGKFVTSVCVSLALLGLLASGPAWAERIEIIVAAGASHDPNSATQSGCSRDHSSNCGLYRLIFDTDNGSVSSVQKIVDHAGLADWFPTVSPDGQQVAYNYRDASGVQWLNVSRMDGSSDVSLAMNTRFPHFADSRESLAAMVEIVDPDTGKKRKSIYSYSLYYDRFGQVNQVNRRPLIEFNDTYDYTDPFVTRDKLTVTRIDQHASGSCSSDVSVEAMNRDPRRTFELELGGVGAQCCGHSAFSPDGSTVACSSTDAGHKVYRFQFQPLLATELSRSRSVFNGFSRGEFRVAGRYMSPDASPMWKHKNIRELSKINPRFNEDLCEKLFHSYIEWCEDEDRVIVSVQCARRDAIDGHDDSSKDQETEYSRVFVVDLKEPSDPIYYDVMSGFETVEGLEAYTMEAVTGTCHAISPSLPMQHREDMADFTP